MGELAFLFLKIATGCFVAAFLIEVVLNRRPIAVALAVPLAAFVVVAVRAGSEAGFSDVFGMAVIFTAIMVPGFLTSLIGSGLGRGLRLAIEKYQQSHTNE